MSDVLTRDEYLSLAKTLELPGNAFINGRFVPAASGTTFATVNPASDEVLQHIAACDAADVEHAAGKAREAFDSGAWSKRHPSDRKEVLLRLARLIRRHRHQLALLESLESGKPIRDCETIDVPETAHCIQWHAEAIDKLYDQIAPTGGNALGLIVREPLGVVASVLPWNFPLMMAAWKLGPALAAGNSVILKPAEQTSMSTLYLAELATEAGLPAGVLNVVTGFGESAGQAIGLHPQIDMVSFTGSTEVGRLFLKYAADSNLKRVVLECGGKNPFVVLDDAERLDSIAEHATQAAFWNMGENCSASSRLIVHKKVKDALLAKIIEKSRDWVVGDPLDPRNSLGSMVSREHFEQVAGHIEKGRAEGARLVLGGECDERGLFIQPTIFDGVTPDMNIAKEEIFGPVLAVITVNSAEEAVRVANDTCYGLAASLFTGSLRRAHRLAREIKAGTVTVNCYGEGDISTPFGGYKQSGFGGRDNSLAAHEQYTETKTIWIDLDDDAESELD